MNKNNAEDISINFKLRAVFLLGLAFLSLCISIFFYFSMLILLPFLLPHTSLHWWSEVRVKMKKEYSYLFISLLPLYFSVTSSVYLFFLVLLFFPLSFPPHFTSKGELCVKMEKRRIYFFIFLVPLFLFLLPLFTSICSFFCFFYQRWPNQTSLAYNFQL